jgi:hypothetical protein
LDQGLRGRQVSHHLRLHRERQPDLGSRGCCPYKTGRRDADDNEQRLIQPNGLPDNSGIAPETTLPECVTQYGDSVRGRKLFANERPAEHGCGAQYSEVIFSYQHA